MTKVSGKDLRHELKYEIAPLQYQILKKKIALLFKPDPFSGPEGGYHVRNLYFDDFRNTSLFEKWAGIYTREKYRMRIYDHNDAKIKFERKIKFGNYILKEDVKLTREEADRIIVGDLDFLTNSENHLLKTFYLESRQNLLQPVVVVEYYREAFYNPASHVRINFDSDLRTGLGSVSLFDPNIPTMRVVDEPNVIMEIKFRDVFAHFIQGLFSADTQPRLAIGKFALCRDQQMCLFGGAIGGLPYARTSKTLPQDKECIN
jgi:hypothetical protein